MRRMHKSDMCGVNKSLPYIAMVPLGCPQPTLSGMVPHCRCAQLFRPMFSRKSGVVKCISRNAVDAANILWLISGNPEKPDIHQPHKTPLSPHRAHSRGARFTTPSPPPPARHKTPWPWCQRPVTDSILPGRCVRGIARGTPSPAQRKGSGMAGESGAGPRPPPLYNRRALPRRPATRTQALPAAGGVGESVPSTGHTTALVLFPLLIYHPTSAFNAAREEAGRPW